MVSYFSHDSNARNDAKILDLRMKHGAEGYGVYFMIIERLREEQDYMSVKDYNILAFDLRVRSDLVKSVVEDFGLFQFKDELFYSESLLKRMGIMEEISEKRSRAGKKGAESRWNNGKNGNAIKNNGKAMANASGNMANAIEKHGNKTNKTNKINKIKQTKENELFECFWDSYPKKIGKTKAKQVFEKINPNDDLVDKMIAKVEEYKLTNQWLKDNGQFIPHPTTWLNQGRWEDELTTQTVSEAERIMNL